MVFIIGSLVSHLIACIRVREATAVMTIYEQSNKIRSIYEDGTEEVAGTSKHDSHENNRFERLKPSLKLLHKAVHGGQGTGY